jgi:ADP-ribose pyrophosphatase YjhB (NUDIX family)
MHPLQEHILKILIEEKTARYVNLKPKGTESNKFVYHLRALVGGGYVLKDGNRYRLSAGGKRYVDKLSLKSFSPRLQPKIVTIILCKNKEEKYLVYECRREPFSGFLAFPYGKIHFGEKLNEAAYRELKEKTGISAALQHCGDAYVTIREHGEVVSHMLCHVFSGSNPSGTLVPHRTITSLGWVAMDSQNHQKLIPGFLKIYKLSITSKKPFLEEISV